MHGLTTDSLEKHSVLLLLLFDHCRLLYFFENIFKKAINVTIHKQLPIVAWHINVKF